MPNACYRCQGNKKINLRLKVFRIHRSANEHLGRTFTVPDVSHLILASKRSNIIDESRSIIETHVFEVEIPVYRLVFRVIRVQVLVILTVSTASVVSHPDIVASIS